LPHGGHNLKHQCTTATAKRCLLHLSIGPLLNFGSEPGSIPLAAPINWRETQAPAVQFLA
jgi:hypothetical protein